jgi:hypothetical protein
MVLLVGSVSFMKWSFGDEPYTSLSMLLGIVAVPFGIGLITISLEVRKNYKNKIGAE